MATRLCCFVLSFVVALSSAAVHLTLQRPTCQTSPGRAFTEVHSVDMSVENVAVEHCCTMVSFAAEETAEADDSVPNWIVRLFPHTGEPDQLQHRFRRLNVEQFDVQGQSAVAVTVELKYPGLDGRDQTAQARVFLPPCLQEDPMQQVPWVHNAGYEINAAGATPLLAKGFAVSTIHAHPLNPLGRGVNLDRAVMHAVRQLPCIDPLLVSIQGGSAGGWMTLMLTADSFPLVWAAPDVPPIHWGYNADYIAKHAAMAGPPAGSDEPRLPVVLAVTPIAEQSRELYGVPFDSEAYFASSPLAHLDTVTAPTLVTFSTADMLVPIDQASTKLVQPFDEDRFPPGFSTAMTKQFPGVDGDRTLLSALPSEQYEMFELRARENQARLDLANPNQGEPVSAELPFSTEKTWSIVILDEGPVEPRVGHFKYAWALDHRPFQKWAEQQGVLADQLTTLKLQRLMQRVAGVPWRPFKFRPDPEGELVEAHQLDYPAAERADVLTGLAAFAASDTCARRLSECYSQLPNEWKVLGPELGDGTPEDVRRTLEDKMKSTP